jgi:glycolate oxidase iron-sulfur subunit
MQSTPPLRNPQPVNRPALPAGIPFDQKKLDACIGCGLCLPACPTYQVTGSEADSPRGRIYLMDAWNQQVQHQQETTATPGTQEHLDKCVQCHACTTVCPSGVEYSSLIGQSKIALVGQRPAWARALQRWLVGKVLPSPVGLTILRQALRTYQLSGLQFLVRQTQILGKNRLAQLEGLLAVIPSVRPVKPTVVPEEKDLYASGTAALFLGCLVNNLSNSVNLASRRLLLTSRYQVAIPPQTCCGAIAARAGEVDIARSLAVRNLKGFAKQPTEYIVTNSASCGAFLKDYPQLLADDPEYRELAKSYASRVADMGQFLSRTQREPMTHAINMRVAYQHSCHLNYKLQSSADTLNMLQKIPGLELVSFTESEMCCGAGELFNIFEPEMSLQVGERKMDYLADAGADVVVVGSPGCMAQLSRGVRERGLKIKVMHPVELLDWAYSGPFPEEI